LDFSFRISEIQHPESEIQNRHSSLITRHFFGMKSALVHQPNHAI